ncbi:MAG: hypothetical protein J5967_04035, partial [Oscillospiraceae bacterium]|nr:hypothetical protein [Oscillospiraceae bacterium]
MEILINQILTHKEAAVLPSLLESGGLPALISGLSPVHRANLAAALKNQLGLPLFVICPDDTAAESMARDLAAMLGREVRTLLMRDFVFYPAEAVYEEQMAAADTPHFHPQILEDLKAEAKSRGLWNLFQPHKE